MTGKKINRIIIISIVIFCIIIGCYGVYKYNLLDKLDKQHDEDIKKFNSQLETDLQEYQDYVNGLHDTTKSPEIQDSTIVSPNKEKVNFENMSIKEIYTRAENQYKLSSYAQSQISNGSIKINGNVQGLSIAKFQNQTLTLNVLKSQSGEQALFKFKLNGNVNVSGIKNVNLNFNYSTYKENNNYYIFDNAPWKKDSTHAWSTFIKFNGALIEPEAISNPNDKLSNTSSKYAVIKVNANYLTRMNKIIKAGLNAENGPTIHSLIMYTTFDDYGNFKEIRYAINFSINLKYKNYNISTNVVGNFTEVFEATGPKGNNYGVTISRPPNLPL